MADRGLQKQALTELFINLSMKENLRRIFLVLQTATIDLCGQNLSYADFEVELLKRCTNQRRQFVPQWRIEQMIIPDVFEFARIQKFLQRKIRNVTFQNFYLHFENVGTKVPAGVYDS